MPDGLPPVRVFLDANTLRGVQTARTLLSTETSGLAMCHYSDYVLDEVRRNVPARIRGDKIERRLTEMTDEFHGRVSGYDHLIHEMPADPKDRPVLAAAIHCGADLLITDNHRDFWPERTQLTIRCLSTSDFLRALVARDPNHVLQGIDWVISAAGFPHPATRAGYLDLAMRSPELRDFARTLNQTLPDRERGQHPELSTTPAPLSPVAQLLAAVRPAGSRLDPRRHAQNTPPASRRHLRRHDIDNHHTR